MNKELTPNEIAALSHDHQLLLMSPKERPRDIMNLLMKYTKPP